MEKVKKKPPQCENKPMRVKKDQTVVHYVRMQKYLEKTEPTV